ncbi:MAG TPA: hypothetical protein VKZ67_03965 [Natronosporangium sp.]|nr:hypothetical protein [Natronosporangium sp.]
MLTTALPRRSVVLTVVSAVAALVLGALAAPAHAEETDDEGGTRSLREALDEAATAYQDAKAVLDESEKRELALLVRLDELENEREELIEQIQVTAATAYRSGRVGAITALLNSTSTNTFLQRVAAVDMLAKRENEQLARLRELTEEVEAQHELLREEIALQEEEVAKLEAAKEKAEQALFAIGGGSSGEFEAYPSEDAAPAPRNSDGSWPAESCSEPDPTTSGCLTPRTLHALNEARLFGFTRYTSCWRAGSWGEHPLGRACDFSSSPNGFAGPAYGTDKTYGDRLASFFVHNANALGVQYVIWYRQIWFPGSGWSYYGGSDGTPNGDHTNHVHVSIR